MIEVVAHARCIPESELDRLNITAGAAGSHARLLQREIDPRWSVCYVRWTEGARLKAALPVYECRSATWPDRSYDPRTWALPQRISAECAARDSLLVGGYSDLRTALHLDRQARGPHHLRTLLASIARLAIEGGGKCIVFPYIYPQDKDALTQATRGKITWTELGREAHLDDVTDPGWEEHLSSRVRYVLRRDRRLISEAGVSGRICGWAEVADSACSLIAEHNIRKGKFDNPAFVLMRHQEWDDCPAVKLLVFTASAGSISGVLTAFEWNGQLELYEIGLNGAASADRIAVYLSLVFHLPLDFARSQGLAHIRVGRAAETAKSARGARLVQLYGGVLGQDHTRQLAQDCAHDQRVHPSAPAELTRSGDL